MAPNSAPAMNPERILSLACNYSLNFNTNALRPLRRVLESIPRIKDEMARSGGFNSLMEQAASEGRYLEGFNSLFEIQDTLI